MVRAKWAPGRGEIVRLDFNPQSGSEQAGRRPALVVSPEPYNRKVGLGLFVPVTSVEKGYPFEVRLPGDLKTSGVVLSDQVKCLDWRARKAVFVEKVPDSVLAEVLARIATLLS
jgi:mRNA interferase MazF